MRNVRHALGWGLAAILMLFIGSSVGCSKSSSKSETGGITAKIAGAAEVKAALAKKDFAAVVQAVNTAASSVSTEADQAEYRKLINESLNELRAFRETDPKAEEAFQALRVMFMGR